MRSVPSVRFSRLKRRRSDSSFEREGQHEGRSSLGCVELTTPKRQGRCWFGSNYLSTGGRSARSRRKNTVGAYATLAHLSYQRLVSLRLTSPLAGQGTGLLTHGQRRTQCPFLRPNSSDLNGSSLPALFPCSFGTSMATP